MASIYKVKRNQNLFDVSVQLYGSIEGIFDLLMTNDITANTVLVEGQELEYHDSFVRNKDVLSTLNRLGTVMAHGNGTIAPIPKLSNTRYTLGVSASKNALGDIYSSFYVSGSGTFYIDWGDGSIEKITLCPVLSEVGHTYAYEGLYKAKIFEVSGSIANIASENDIKIYLLNVNGVFVLGSSVLGGTNVIQ